MLVVVILLMQAIGFLVKWYSLAVYREKEKKKMKPKFDSQSAFVRIVLVTVFVKCVQEKN